MYEKKIEICLGTDRSRVVRVRLSLLIVEGEGVLSEAYHTISIPPDAALTGLRAANEAHLAAPNGGIPGAPWPPIPDAEWAKVEGVIDILHTKEVNAVYAKKQAKALEEFNRGK